MRDMTLHFAVLLVNISVWIFSIYSTIVGISVWIQSRNDDGYRWDRSDTLALLLCVLALLISSICLVIDWNQIG